MGWASNEYKCAKDNCGISHKLLACILFQLCHHSGAIILRDKHPHLIYAYMYEIGADLKWGWVLLQKLFCNIDFLPWH